MDRMDIAKRDAKRLESGGMLDAKYTSVGKDGRVVVEPGLRNEVVRRQQKVQRKSDDGVVACELKPTLKMPGEKKKDWLFKALLAVPKGKADIQDIYEILTHPKFAANVEEWHGAGTYRMVKDHIYLFSEKHQSTLLKKSDLAKFSEGSPSRSRSPSNTARTRKRERTNRSRSRSTGRRESKADSVQAESRADGRAAVAEPLGAPDWEEPHDEASLARKEEKDKIAAALRERHEQQQEELQRQLVEKQAQDEREKLRKAKLGNAFSLDDDEDDVSAQRAMGSSSSGSKTAIAGLQMPSMSVASSSPNVNNRFVESMGGDRVLHDVHKLLMQKIAPENHGMAGPKLKGKSRSPSRNRKKDGSRRKSKSRSRSRRGDNRHQRSTLRSPTPDGRARGQARAARKAKMIASCLGLMGSAPPPTRR